MKTISILFFILCFTVANSFLIIASDTIIGNRFIANYSTENFELQNWAVTQDQRGVMYFGNGAGILEFDGVNWNSIKTSNASTVRSLAIDSTGTIYAGASGDFGFLSFDSVGNIFYKSLLKLLPDSISEIKRILKTFATNQGVYFITEEKIFRYHNNQIHIINANLIGEQRYGFLVRGRIFLIQKDIGLCYIDENEVIPLPHSSSFAKNYGRYVILPYHNNQLLIATQDKGLFLYNLEMVSHKGKIFPGNTEKNTASTITQIFDSEISPYLQAHGLYSSCVVDSNLYALGTITGGIVLMNYKGEFTQIINKEKGLRGNSILDLFMDKFDNLWAALQDGISQIELNSPITFFNELNGLEGIVLTTEKFNGIRYVGTHLGLYYLKPYNFQTEEDNYSFDLIENGKATCLNLYKFKNILIASTSQGILKIQGTKSNIIFENMAPYCFHQNNRFENTLFMGSSKGLGYLKFKPNSLTITENYTYEEITHSIIEMNDDSLGNLWLTTQFNGIIYLEFADNEKTNYTIHRYDTADGLPSLNLNYVHFINNKLLIATQEGVYTVFEENNRKKFIPDTGYCMASLNEKCSVSKLIPGSKNNNFILSENKGVGIYDFVRKTLYTTPFKKIAPESIYNLFLEDNYLWICTIDGLYKYDLNDQKNYEPTYTALIRKVVSGRDSLLFGGAFFNPDSKFETYYTSSLLSQSYPPSELPYKHNSFQFNYSVPFYEDNEQITFQYRLEGFDDEWSDWTDRTEKSYTNLWEGDYTFKVRAKNIYDFQSDISAFSFTIKPPWFRTIIAYIGYILLLGLLFYIGFRLYARRLVAQNIRLEKIIRERTVEIRQQRDQIAEQKQSITDSIQYASRIQNALLPPNEFINKHLPEYFILFKPRDIVSGDFYWLSEHKNKVIITAADCTGHGVPGAFMSMLGISFLNEIVNKSEQVSADFILNELRNYIKTSLRQTGKKNEAKDGMDMALCILDKENMKLEYAGANNPLYLIRNNELESIKSDRMPIGIYIKDDKPFQNNIIEIQQGDVFYIFSDGYVDQFGGEDGKKFMPKNFKSLLLEHHQKPMNYQHDILDQTIEVWKGKNEQVDDILVIGFKIT